MSEFQQNMLNSLLEIIVPVLFMVVLPFLVQLLRGRTKLNKESLVEMIAQSVVAAAEQTLARSSNEDKYAFAVEMTRKRLAEQGISIDDERIREAIEAAVYKVKEKAIQPGPITVGQVFPDLNPVEVLQGDNSA